MLLSKMRKGIFSYIFLGMLLMGGAGLVVMDWTGTYKFAQGSNDVAVIDGHPIKISDFDRLVRRILRSQQMDPKVAYETGMIDQILEIKIVDALFVKAANDFGLAVEDQHVAKQINELLEPMAGKDGNKKEILSRMLQSQNMSEGELVNNLRSEISAKLVRESVSLNYYVPAQLAADLDIYRNESRSAETVFLPYSSVADIKAPDEKTLEAYYETIKFKFTEPESRSFTLAVIDPENFGVKAEVTDAEIKAFYDENLDSFKIQEQRLVQQAVFDNEQKAKEVLAKAKDGKKSLSDAVKDVTGSTKAYTGENAFTQKGLPDQLADPIFKAEIGSYVGPIKSPLGWHVAFVKATEAEHNQAFDKVKEEIRKELLHNKKGDELFAATTEFEDRLAGGESLETLAKELKMTLIPVKDITMGIKDIAALKPYEADENGILEAAFKLQEGETSPLEDLSGGKMFTVRLDDVKERRQKDLKEVKKDVEAQWFENQRQKELAAYVQQTLDKLNNKKMSLNDVAKEKSAKVQSHDGIKRSEAAAQGLKIEAQNVLMSAEKDKFVVMPAEGGLMIGSVTKVDLPQAKSADKDIQTIRELVAKDSSQENLLELVDTLKKQYKTTTNDKLLEQVYGKTEESQ